MQLQVIIRQKEPILGYVRKNYKKRIQAVKGNTFIHVCYEIEIAAVVIYDEDSLLQRTRHKC